MREDFSRYEKILYLSPPSSRHARMPQSDRAKQFAPFSALKGYEECIEALGRTYHNKARLGEYDCDILDENLKQIEESLSSREKVLVHIRYFVATCSHTLGEYEEIRGEVWKIDVDNRQIQVEGTWINLDDIVLIELF